MFQFVPAHRRGAPNRNKHFAHIALCALVFATGFLAGCKGKEPAQVATTNEAAAAAALAAANSTNQAPTTNIMRSFSARGVVRELPAGGKTLLVRHEEIPGFMPRMTMEFDVRDTNELRGLKPGDAIVFYVKATEDDSWIEGIKHTSTNDLAPLPPSGPSAASLLHAAQLKPGDLLPDVELLAEDGKPLRLADFEGKAVAFTFIFTRCPLPNFCPRMNQNFSRAREILFQQSQGPTNWQFLSISFDPDFDKPGVLSRYAYSYRGKREDGWLFASAPTNVMASISPMLDFRFANEGGSFLHNLRTVVLDPERRVFKQFDGNTWKAEELANALIEASRKTGIIAGSAN